MNESWTDIKGHLRVSLYRHTECTACPSDCAGERHYICECPRIDLELLRSRETEVWIVSGSGEGDNEFVQHFYHKDEAVEFMLQYKSEGFDVQSSEHGEDTPMPKTPITHVPKKRVRVRNPQRIGQLRDDFRIDVQYLGGKERKYLKFLTIRKQRYINRRISRVAVEQMTEMYPCSLSEV